MKKSHRRDGIRGLLGAIVLALIFLGAGCSSSKEPEAPAVPEESQEESQKEPEISVEEVQEEEFQQISGADVVLRWKVEESRLSVILEAPTQGWVAVGFDPTGGMEDANFIIGYVEGNHVTVRDDYGTWFSSHDSDEKLGGTSDVEDITGEESTGTTRIGFTIPLDSGDQYDRVLREGREYTVLLAYGKEDSFAAVHSKRSKVKITL